MLARYRYRLYPEPRQVVMLARTFGCARTVFNDGFTLHGDRLYVAKVGDLKVRWSRPLPSVPSSITVIREADGRCYASFVVEVAATPLPATAGDHKRLWRDRQTRACPGRTR